MASEELEALRSELNSMPADKVSAPYMPVAEALQEAYDLYLLIQDDGVWSELTKVGVAETQRERLPTAIAATRHAQSEWVLVRDRSSSGKLAARERGAYDLRSGILVAARWNLRGDRGALATLSAIAAGDGVADLNQDLNDLAELLENRAEAFAADQSFDAVAMAREARRVAVELANDTSAARLDIRQSEAKELRDRAFTQLRGIVDAVREAGRYAFRNDPQTRGLFASEYRRRQRLGRDSPASEMKVSDI